VFKHVADAAERRRVAAAGIRAGRHSQTDYLQTLADNMSVMMLVIDEDGSVQLANRAARQLAGRPVSKLQEIDAIGEAGAASRLALPAGHRQVLRLANSHRVLASAARFTADGAARRLISLQNIETELDAAELKAWQDLVRILSHEMMNSLTPISSPAGSITPLARNLAAAQSGDAAAAAQDVAIAVEAISRRSAGLMNFVERYRKIVAIPRPAPRPIRLTELVAHLRDLIGPTLAAKSIAFESKIEPDDLRVAADPDLLEQALINLLQNAIEAVGDIGEPRVEMRCARRGHDRVEIAVLDNGRGIDPSAYDRMFLPFFTTKAGGSGIGLSLSRQIALAHHGQIEVSPNRQAGTIFRVILPAMQAPVMRAVEN
jgi:nitrogen fixation/metabolism regulation signal transduction histidine kinase